MHASLEVAHRPRAASRGASAVTLLSTRAFERDAPRVAMPYAEVHIGVRFGPSTRSGLDVHVLGGSLTVHRKLIRGGQRSILARLQLGAAESVLGVPASAVLGDRVPIEDLWDGAATRRLCDQLADAKDSFQAATVLERAIGEREACARRPRPHAGLALAAAERLASANVNEVADSLGVSERHLRRIFRAEVGVSPKAYARLTRFHTALRIAQNDTPESWASIAAAAGYYDQAHLIAEFHAIAGVTPRTLMGEMREGLLIG